ncbi:MAG: MFS transporter [Gammaproteobacteria bacterium RIFCSPHIGHO2_12_FULL_41_15]|nr:MAG: MFS transporter [Gammaproteobacteria bacterium RIFCSPHIGHO2_12_FULL_41_15]
MSEALLKQPIALNKTLITITIMLVAILEVLDSTIVNVALPHMMSALGATTEQITWVLTSYIVASAVVLPITGFLSDLMGRKQLLMINILGFMVSSALCGTAITLQEMVVLRIMQGAFGATLIPLSQSVLRETFPLEEQGRAMAIWGIGIMAAPVLGPTLGGYIVQHSSWRWIFYINIPVCILGLVLTHFVIPNSVKQKITRVDWTGLLLMVLGIGSLQLFLDQGNTKDWFNSNFIVAMAAIAIVTMSIFIIRGIVQQDKSLIKFTLYKDRNFAISSILLLSLCGALFGMMALQPVMLENLFGYPAITAGQIMAPRGLASAFGMMTAVPLIKKINVKWLLGIALIHCAIGSFLMANFTLQMNAQAMIFSSVLQGFGMGMFMVPISTYALATLHKKDITEGAGLFSYARMLGTSVGISLLSTLVTRETQINWNRLNGHINQFNPNLDTWLRGAHLRLNSDLTHQVLSNQLAQQANMIAYLDAYYAIGIAFLLLLPLILLMKSVDLRHAKLGAH